jgi:poly-gamma-glutamate synthesis protein (capsule biosynthesis protein)
LQFCSSPERIKLLEDVGTDIVELTGNHLADYGNQWLKTTIEMYQQRGWKVYGGGLNQAEARKAITITHNGNKLAFIGCNPNGPKNDWATSTVPGSADCDYPNMTYLEDAVRQLSGAGYLVIVTFQYFESYEPRPLPVQYQDFRRIFDAGAVIVSGSQAHLPQAMELRGNGFIHYGLGNLFFDQMDTFWPETKDEFVDRHVFYDGKYYGVDLLTAQIEDYTKPRPMTTQERETLLNRIFDVSGWPQNSKKEWK